jgi:mediator of RNA polymerase II transcription subunit 31
MQDIILMNDDENDDRKRFQIELEFVQSLANPDYLNYLAQHGYFKNQKFINYLKYLMYWQKPEYVKYVS